LLEPVLNYICNLYVNVFAICRLSRDSIDYDEYLDGGIPDTLLEGLGFYASSGDAEVTSEADQILDERSKPEVITEPRSQTAVFSTTRGRILFYIFQFLCHIYTSD